MIWFLFAVLTAFFESMKDVFSKKSFNNSQIDEYVAAWALRFFALPFLLPLLFFVEIPVIGQDFYPALIIVGGLHVFSTILFMKALKASDLSITLPMICFTPIFLLITSPLIVGEFPDLFGVIGIVMIVIGAYTLNIKERHGGFFAPFRALLKEKGPRYMLVVAFIFSITSNYDKIGVLNTSPIFWTIAFNLFLSILLFPIMLWKSKNSIKHIGHNLKVLLPIGFFSAVTLIFQMTAISLTLVAYVISIKRISIVLGVLWGGLIFKEKNIKDRMIGAIIMIGGVVLIIVF